MYKFSLKLTLIFLISMLIGCSNDNSEFNSDTQNTKDLKKTTNSAEQGYYLGDSDIMVAYEDSEGLKLTKDIMGETILNDEDTPISIEDVSFHYTEKEYMNYIFIIGTSEEKDENGELVTMSYHIGFPIFNQPNYSASSANEETHTCKSSEDLLWHCDGICKFAYDQWNCISGCRCSTGMGSICVHSVTTTVNNLNLSLQALL